ncbi:radical SAM protein [Candidatus Omnitrophota bacterium]
MEIREVKAGRILNPTSIDLGEYVINPYKGCANSCVYCYVKSNRVTRNEARRWGEYVDVRANAPELLEKELSLRKPRKVLLGSTTECFQPVEAEYGITRKVLGILNEKKVRYSILTRSPLLREYIPLLKAGCCESVYFTFNNYSEPLKEKLEPASASFSERIDTINTLLKEGVPVIPYLSPLLPFVSDLRGVFFNFELSKTVEFEGLNFNLGNINEVIKALTGIRPDLEGRYNAMKEDPVFYDEVWRGIKKDVVREAIKAKKNHHIYVHSLSSYFENKYAKRKEC